MTTVVLNPEFEELLEGLSETRLPGLELQFEPQLDNFSLREELVVGDPSLNANGLTMTLNGMDPADPTLYTFIISGTGFTPVNTLDALEAALRNGTADGTFNRVSIDYGAQRIAQLDLTSDGFTLSSGTQQIQLTGGFPVSLQEVFTIVDILDPELDVEGSLADYGFTDFTLREGGEVLASLSTDGDLVLNLDGFVLKLEDADIDVETALDFLRPGREQIVPTLAIFDEDGAQVFDGVSPNNVPWSDNSNSLFFNVPDGGGTFYLQIGAAPLGITPWQTETGLYEANSSFWGSTPNANLATRENIGDAPANTSTPYNLFSGANFAGEIDRVGDIDWIRIDLPDPADGFFGAWNYPATPADGVEGFVPGAIRIDVFGTGQPEPVLRDLPGVNFSGLTITTPDGTEVVSATDVESFAAFLDALDAALHEFAPALPDIGGLGLAFATGDPHLLTHDGLGYDFHAAGEYVLMRATNGLDFELQSRMEPAGENVTANTSAGLRVGDDVIMVSASGPALRVNGSEIALSDGETLGLDNALIARHGNSYRIFIQDPTGANSLVQVDIIGARVDIGVGLTDFWRNNVEGLLGNFSGTIQDDLRVAGTGEAVSIPLQYGDTDGKIGLYGAFRESWRVSDETTLFTYEDGFAPDSYYLPDYPGVMITLDDFSGDALAAAQAAAEAAGLAVGSFAFNNAVLDLLVTGDESFIESATNTQAALVEVGAPNEAIHVPEVVQDSGILDQLLTIGGSVSSIYVQALNNTTVTFTREGSAVNLTRETRDGEDFSFRLSEGAAGRINATRDWDPGAGDPTVTALDALDVLRMAVGLTPSFGEAKAQNFIAADVNSDGAVTALDALEVLRAAVGLSTEHAPRWVFFDAATDWDSVEASRLSVKAPETGIDLTAASSLDGLGLQGILLGHMVEV